MPFFLEEHFEASIFGISNCKKLSKKSIGLAVWLPVISEYCYIFKFSIKLWFICLVGEF